MGIDEYVKNNSQCYSIKEGLALYRIEPGRPVCNAVLSEVHVLAFVSSGSLDLLLDGQHCQMRAGCFADILHSKIELSNAAPCTDAHILIFTETFLTNLLKNSPPFPFSYAMERMDKPFFYLADKAQIEVMTQRLGMIENLFADYTHFFRTEMLKAAMNMLFMDIGNLYIQKNLSQKVEGENRYQVLFKQFVDLLHENVTQEHTVGYYAGKMCITPQYLARVIKESSGHTVYQWIQKALLIEINKLLGDTDLTIQQIADQCHFCDTSTFSKFYKRYTGLPPTQYRRKRER